MRRLELIFLLSASGGGYSPSAAARRDGAIAEATERGRTASALNIVGGQRKARGELVGERQREAGGIGSPQDRTRQRGPSGWPAETEAAPIRYVAELIGADADSERAIRWLIALLVLCCDPLAIALTAAASARR